MGFYGNITNVNNSTFVFDKIYANRKDMERNAEYDGIFVGRYVLVDYNLDNPYPGSQQKRLYQNTRYPQHFYFSQEDAGGTTIGDSIAIYYDESYYIEDEEGKTIINPKTNDPAYSHCIFKGQIIYTLINNVYTYYECIGDQTFVDYSSYPYITTSGIAKFISATNQDTYYKNFQSDREEYGNVGRGYDSTVWQKTFSPTEGQKYVMLAELNSVVPTLDITADAPTLNPISPHFDADSTNVYYKLHMQPSWGFKVKENIEYIKPKEYKEGITYYRYNSIDNIYDPVSSNVNESNYNLYYIKIFKPSDEKASSLENNWDPVAKKNIRKGKNNYDSAIYYNKDGFNSEYRYVKPEEENINIVKIEPTGFSGQKYNTVHGSGAIKTEAKPDMLEFTFNMPAIGNTISQVWDLIYGQGELDDEEQEIYRRNKNIEWDNISGLRLVQENSDGSGYTYNKDKVETLAGCINSIHDLMGMIITQEEKLEDETEEAFKQRTSIENALINRIYYGHYEPERVNNDVPYKGYYIKEFVYDITDDGSIAEETIELKDFSQAEYYYLNNNNYYLETTGYHSGNKYYKLNLNPNINEYSEEYEINYKELYSEDYEPNKYYYKDNDNYILSAVKYPNEDLEYYIVESGKEAEIIDSTKSQFFFPTADDEYYRANFATTELIPVTINNLTKYQGSGLFYRGTDPQTQELAYFPFIPGETPYQTPLVWFDNFLVEFATDLDGNVIQVYEFDKGSTKGTDYTMIKFEPNKYYYYHEDEEYSGYILLKDLKDIDIEKIYYSFPQEEKFIPINLDFYRPDLYYYKEGNNYILGKENKKLNRQYYLINKPESTNEVFYEPNKYYYKLNNEFILDDSKVLVEEHKPYYKEGVHLYVKSDSNKILTEGAKWNTAISEKPDGVVLGRRIEKPVWRELPGFSRTLNTIHGLILELNRLIKFEDNITRDTTTVQGCINKINDIIRNFGKLVPGQILIVDNYGRIASSSYTANQDVKAKRYNFNYEELEFNDSDIEIEVKEGQAEEGWLGIAIEDDQDRLNIGFEHKYNPVEEQEPQNTNMNDVGDKFGIIKPVIDNTGHTIAIDKEIIQLPNGYKYIETDNGEPNKIEAQNSKDTFILKGDDSWLSSTAGIVENKAQIEFTHLYPNQTADTFTELDMNNISSDGITEEEKVNKENKIVLESVNLDETGHVTNKNFDTITLPYGYKYVKAEGEENNTITAENTQDTFSVIGDKNKEDQWIKTSILTEGKGIKIEHDDPSEVQLRNLDNSTPKFGGSFEIEDWTFDSKGHKANVSTHSVILPKGDLIEKEVGTVATELNAIANVEFEPETGIITLTRKDISDFKLKPIDNNISQSLSGEVIFTEKLGEALFKLQNQLIILNGNHTIENSVDYKINQAVTEINDTILSFMEKNDNEKLDTLEEVVDWITNDVRIDGAVAMQESIVDIEKDLNIQGQDIKNLTSSLQEKTEDLKQINNEILPTLTQEDINLHNRCDTLDKEVKNLINLTAPYEEKIKYLDEKIKYLEDKIKALTGE